MAVSIQGLKGRIIFCGIVALNTLAMEIKHLDLLTIRFLSSFYFCFLHFNSSICTQYFYFYQSKRVHALLPSLLTPRSAQLHLSYPHRHWLRSCEVLWSLLPWSRFTDRAPSGGVLEVLLRVFRCVRALSRKQTVTHRLSAAPCCLLNFNKQREPSCSTQDLWWRTVDQWRTDVIFKSCFVFPLFSVYDLLQVDRCIIPSDYCRFICLPLCACTATHSLSSFLWHDI